MERFLVGRKISLHGLSDENLTEHSPYVTWMNDLSNDEYTERARFPYRAEDARLYYEKACVDPTLVLLGIFDNESDKHIGNISFKDINMASRRGWLGYLIGDKGFRGKGLATEAVLMFMYYGFNKLNLARVFTTISADNAPSLRIAEKVGLINEGRMRRHILIGGKELDVFTFGALHDEWMASFSSTAKECYNGIYF